MTQLRVGTSGYAYREWRGRFYPKNLPAHEMLRFYGQRFNTVEINHTFYHTPERRLVKQWPGSVPNGFQFAVKANQRITHIQRLRGCKGLLRRFLRGVSVLEKQGCLGPILVQLPPNFRADLKILEKFLKLCPHAVHYAFEFRHASWYAEETYSLLRHHGAALCLAETDDQAPPGILTASFTYVRLRRSTYGRKRLAAWKQRFDAWLNQGISVFAYFQHEETGKAPVYARRLLSS